MVSHASTEQNRILPCSQGWIQNLEKGGWKFFYKFMPLCGVLVEEFLCYRRHHPSMNIAKQNLCCATSNLNVCQNHVTILYSANQSMTDCYFAAIIPSLVDYWQNVSLSRSVIIKTWQNIENWWKYNVSVIFWIWNSSSHNSFISILFVPIIYLWKYSSIFQVVDI